MSAIQLTSGMRQNLYALQSTQTLLEGTQSKLSSGLKVQSALDDPINYFSAQSHRQRANDLSQLKDAMGEAIQTVKAGNNGIEAITDLIAQAKSLAQSAKSAEDTGTALDLQNQYNEVLDQIAYLADDSGYKGINLLGGTTEELDVLFSENGTSNKITLTGFDVGDAGTGSSINISDVLVESAGSASCIWYDSNGVSATGIQASIDDLDSARDELRTQAKKMADNLSTITTRQEFTTNMINTLEDGASGLTEADMNEEGANMLMLQTRQQLGTTSLSLASQAAQSVLRLF